MTGCFLLFIGFLAFCVGPTARLPWWCCKRPSAHFLPSIPPAQPG
jgi:hypothetical protein